MRTRKKVWKIILDYYLKQIENLNTSTTTVWNISICKITYDTYHHNYSLITEEEYCRCHEELIKYGKSRKIQYEEDDSIISSDGYFWKSNDTKSRINWLTKRI